MLMLIQRRVMPRGCVARIALADDPGMAADLAAAMIDDDLAGMLVHADRVTDQALRNRVTVAEP
jgi:hypothetical protein